MRHGGSVGLHLSRPLPSPTFPVLPGPWYTTSCRDITFEMAMKHTGAAEVLVLVQRLWSVVHESRTSHRGRESDLLQPLLYERHMVCCGAEGLPASRLRLGCFRRGSQPRNPTPHARPPATPGYATPCGARCCVVLTVRVRVLPSVLRARSTSVCCLTFESGPWWTRCLWSECCRWSPAPRVCTSPRMPCTCSPCP